MLERREITAKDVVEALVLTLSPKPLTAEEKMSIIDDVLTQLQRKGLVTSWQIFQTEKSLLRRLQTFKLSRELKRLAGVS
jgi:DNA integrity scanning protein DisA with diadenylate cyclase activity